MTYNVVNRKQARIILDGLFPTGMEVEKLTKTGRAELRAAVDVLLKIMEKSDDPILAPDRPADPLR